MAMENDVSNISVIEVQDINSLSNIKGAINEFLDDSLVHSDPCHYPDYIENTVKHDASLVEWSLLVIKNSDEIIAIIPFYIRRNKFPIKFALFNLFSFKVNMLNFFGEGYSYRSDDDLPVVHKILSKRLKSINQFDLGMINALPANSLLLSYFQGEKNNDIVLKPLSQKLDVVRYINFPESWDDYLLSMKRKRRYNLKRNIKIIKEHCEDDLVLKCFKTEDAVEPFFVQMDEIYKNTWQSSAFGSKSRMTELEINQNKSLAKLGCFKSYILQASQSPIAFIRGYLFKGKYYYEEIGYKQDWAKFNPGSVLNFLMLEHLMGDETSVRELNFGYGENVYKQVFSNGAYKATNVYLFRKRSKGHLIFLVQKSLDYIYVVIRKGIVKLNLDVVVRRVLRKYF